MLKLKIVRSGSIPGPISRSRCSFSWIMGRIFLAMKQSDAIQFLYKDLKVVTSSLVIPGYVHVFEEELQEYFPFNEAIMEWLTRIYSS